MATAGKAYPLGPFKQGMVNVSEMTELADDQVALAVNFDVDLDGSFTSRPAIVPEHYSPIISNQVIYTNECPNPSLNTVSAKQELYRNQIQNTQLALDSVGWNGGANGGLGTVARTNLALGFSWWMQVTFTGNVTGGGSGVYNYASGKNPVTPGEVYSAGIYGMVTWADAMTGLRVYFYTAGGVLIPGSQVDGPITVHPQNGVQRQLLEGITAPPTAAFARIDFLHFSGENPSTGDRLAATGATFTKTPRDIGFFDGLTSDTADDFYTFAGTANASESIWSANGVYGFPFTPFLQNRVAQVSNAQLVKGGRIIPIDSSNDTCATLTITPTVAEMAGKTFTLSARIQVTAQQKGALHANARRLQIIALAPSGNKVYTSDAAPNWSSITELSVVGAIPADATYVSFRIYNGASIGNGIVNFDLVTLVGVAAGQPAYDGTYFSGDTANVPDPLGGSKVFAWTGTSNNSTSTISVPNRGAQQLLEPLGFYVRADGKTFLVCTTNGKTWIYDIDLKTFTEIWANKAADFTQYDNKIVLISETIAGGYWEGGTFTATATMPLGSSIALYQERLWAYGVKGTATATRVWFSNITSAGASPTSIWTWTTATDFFEVNKGDGQWITGLLPDVNALIIFRSGSTFRFTYPSSPFSGTLVEISSVIGADNRRAFVQYESYYLVFNQNRLYQFINYQFYSLNEKRIRFDGDSLPYAARHDVRVTIFGSRCMVWYRGGLYVYNLVSAAWTTWRSTLTFASMFMQIPQSSLADGTAQALAFTGINMPYWGLVFRVVDAALTSGEGEFMTCMIRTKSYDIEESAQYKRMFKWAMDVRGSYGARGIAYPSALPSDGVTWDEMSAKTWDELSKGSWDNPLVVQPSFITNVSFPTAAPVRVTIQAGQDSYFTRMNFDIYLDTTGTAATAPAKIYGITPYVRIGSGLSKQVS